MKNIINYYYSMYPIEIFESNSLYFFDYNDSKYIFVIYNRPEQDIKSLYELNKTLLGKDMLVNEIVVNNDNQIITNVNNQKYILLKINININSLINTYDLYSFINKTIDLKTDDILDRTNWVTLWESKNDYYENQLEELIGNYKIINSYLNYYIGLAENAILYLKNNFNNYQDIRVSICHKRVRYNEKAYMFYNPMELICDYFIRDISEYVKSIFFISHEKAFNYVISFFNTFNPNYKEAQLFYARLLYPSYFFDIYDDVINGIKKEDEVEKIITQSSSYETFLLNVYLYISRFYNKPFDSITWINKH